MCCTKRRGKMAKEKTLIEMIDISKSYDGEIVLDEFNLNIK